METRQSDMFSVLGRSLVLLCFIASLGFAAVLPGTTPSASSQHPLVGDGIRVAYVKTNFSCVGRPSGYYADVDTGCELYHMCDGLGRQFSYACPNTTLFQQRMLICDHWYMVNCSKAEGDYSANLLIGQRDKPFVGEDENELRTPRPDLRDRPYSADYSGESFRRHYKSLQQHLSSPGNALASESNQVPEYVPIHWETSISNTQRDSNSGLAATQVTAESHTTVNGLLIHSAPMGFSKPEIVRSLDVTDNIKIPSIIYELPNQHPDYSLIQTNSTTNYGEQGKTPNPQKKVNLSPSTFAKAFVPSNPNQLQLHINEKHFETTKPSSSPASKRIAGGAARKNVVHDQIAVATSKPDPPVTQAALPPQTTTIPTTTSTTPKPVTESSSVANKKFSNSIPEPIDGLQPPHTFYRTYDDSTTEGPPIYYQWKWAVPAFVLEPPKLSDSVTTTTSEDKSPTARSIGDKSQTTTAEEHPPVKINTSFFKKASPQPKHNFAELQKTHSIPAFEFPLEEDSHHGLLNANALNSYQLTIPANVRSDQSWYGENPQCPECHPAYLQPGGN